MVIVPGCYGSKMNVVNRYSKKRVRAWFHQKFFPKVMQGEAAINYLWGHYDESGLVESFINEFADYEVEKRDFGFDGCDRFFESSLLAAFNGYFLAYMAPIVNFLRKNGYTLGKDLFCYTYDWRQSAYHPKVIDDFKTYLEGIVAQLPGGQKPVLITHSGGIIYIQALMKQIDTSSLFKSIITINCPFDGSGASASVTEISGYNLHMPMTHLAMKGCECFTGGQLGYLSLPTSTFISRG